MTISYFQSARTAKLTDSRNRAGLAKGGVLLEVLIVGLLLSIVSVFLVMPRFSGADNTREVQSLKQELGFMRRQLERYIQHHSGVSPGYPRGRVRQQPTAVAFVGQLTRATDKQGQIGVSHDAEHPLGPYLTDIPINPLTDSSKVLVLLDDEAMPERVELLSGLERAAGSGARFGWVYHPASNTLRAIVQGADADGLEYFCY